MFRLFGDDVVAPPKVVEPQVTTAVFEKTEDVQVAEPVKEESPLEKKEQDVASEEDDKAKTPIVDAPTEELDISTVSSEPDYVNVSMKTDSTNTDKHEENAPKEIKEANEEPVVTKEKPKPASWALLVAGGSNEPVQEEPKPKKMAPVKKDPAPEKASSSTSKPNGQPRTLYISQLPSDIVEADIRELFEIYGAIKKIDVHAHKGFAFVDFADASSVKKAMQNASQFSIRETSILIEERQTKGTSSGTKNANNNRGGRGVGGNNGGNRQGGQKGGDKKQGDNKGGNNNNRNNKTGNKAGNSKQSNNAK